MLRITLLLAMVVPHFAFSGFYKAGTDSSLGDNIKVTGSVGSGIFDPMKISNWLPDARSPIIAPSPGGTCPDAYGNIYNPTVVSNGPTSWNIYYGGWDGSPPAWTLYP